MAHVVGQDTSQYQRFTCGGCKSIISYGPLDVKRTISAGMGRTQTRDYMDSVRCPACGTNQVLRTGMYFG